MNYMPTLLRDNKVKYSITIKEYYGAIDVTHEISIEESYLKGEVGSVSDVSTDADMTSKRIKQFSISNRIAEERVIGNITKIHTQSLKLLYGESVQIVVQGRQYNNKAEYQRSYNTFKQAANDRRSNPTDDILGDFLRRQSRGQNPFEGQDFSM